MRICYLDVHEWQYKRLTTNTPTEAATKINLESKLQVKNVRFALFVYISLFNLAGFLLTVFRSKLLR